MHGLVRATYADEKFESCVQFNLSTRLHCIFPDTSFACTVPALYRRSAVYTEKCNVMMPSCIACARRVVSHIYLPSVVSTRCTNLSICPQPAGEAHRETCCSGGNPVTDSHVLHEAKMPVFVGFVLTTSRSQLPSLQYVVSLSYRL